MERKTNSAQVREDKVNKIISGSGPLAIVMIRLVDYCIGLVIDFFSLFSDLVSDGYDTAYDTTLGNFAGILGAEKHGICFDYKAMRYLITILTPPVGIFMGKGLRGWFTIILNLIICSINYPLGIIYAFIVTAKNRYADRYEKMDKFRVWKKREELKLNGGKPKDFTFFVGLAMMIGIIALPIYLIIKYS
tara:strand:+ start:1104 stop:1673 length:570 start_codon:yes stop_codon:yes gene_type:complete